jgi:hypothetical protein
MFLCIVLEDRERKMGSIYNFYTPISGIGNGKADLVIRE